MTLPNVQSTFCSSRSRDAGENLFGTASSYGVYLAVEFNAQWTPDKDAGFLAKTFHGADRERWNTFWSALPEPRLQIIRQRGHSTNEDGITVYVAIPHEVNPLLYKFELESYSTLLDLPMPKLLTGDIEYHNYLIDEPLYLVCTHANYDPCCARHGLPIYKAFSEAVSTSTVWQSTHLGGHRFAGTGLILPHGIYYGRIDRDDVPTIIEAYHEGRLIPEYYRGRACYDEVEQTAEYYLRRESGNMYLEAFRRLESNKTGEFEWEVRFEELGKDIIHTVRLASQLSDWAIPMSCSKEEVESRPVYTLVNYTVTQP